MTKLNPAIEDGESPLVLWAESPEEARNFIRRAQRQFKSFSVDRIFVAKRSPRVRGNHYTAGRYLRTQTAQYFLTTDDGHVDVYDEAVKAPDAIRDLVQWCTCDVMLSRGPNPIVAVEDTTHIVRMNLYQRVPRMARAAMLGVPGCVLQGTRGLNLELRGDRWALYRYLQAFEAIARLHPKSPTLPIWYLPSPEDEMRAESELIEYIQALISGKSAGVQGITRVVIQRLNEILKDGVDGEIPPDLPSINFRGLDEVVVKIGAKPDKKSWRDKGSGQMDPYVGLIAAAKYMYCYDIDGRKTKDLVVEFTYLPEGFWFFKDPETTALYRRLPIQLADRVRFLGN